MMRDCEDGAMRDLLPDYVNDTLSEAEHAKVEAHLRTCADCTAEVELIEAAGRAYPAPTIDVDRIMKAIPFAPEDSPEMQRSQPGWLGAAVVGDRALNARRLWLFAASIAAILFGAYRYFLPAPAAPIAQAPVVAPAPKVVQPLTVPVESSVVAAAPAQVHAPAPSATHRGASISFGGGLDDLSDAQLAALLSELDTLEALPSTEPETHLSPIVPEADGGSNAR